MSRIGKKEIKIPSGVSVELNGQTIKISSSKANLELTAHDDINVEYDSSQSEVRVTRKNDDRKSRALHGTTRALIANMIEGVLKGYSIGIEIFGTGYGVKEQGTDLYLTVGTAKPFVLPIPAGVKLDIKTPNARGNDVPAAFAVVGADKQSVGQFAAEIRRSRPAEPYLGKGIRYAGEIIKRKAGKAFGSGGA